MKRLCYELLFKFNKVLINGEGNDLDSYGFRKMNEIGVLFGIKEVKFSIKIPQKTLKSK